MRHPRASVTGTEKPTKRGFWRLALAVAALLLVGSLLVFKPFWMAITVRWRNSATGQVLQTRISVEGSRESGFGGRTRYRIEALVRYDLHGQVHESWMPASEVTADRDLLALRLVKHPDSCQVYWAPRHEDNPNCRFK